MEENKKDQLDKIDELLESTSAENRIKFKEDDAIDLLSSQEKETVETPIEPTVNNIEATDISDDESEEDESADSICIIRQHRIISEPKQRRSP